MMINTRLLGNIISINISILGTLSAYALSWYLAYQSKYLFGEYSNFIFLLNIFLSSAGVGIDIQVIRNKLAFSTFKTKYYLTVGLMLNIILCVLYSLFVIFIGNYHYLFGVLIILIHYLIIYITGMLQSNKKFLSMSIFFNSYNILRFFSILLLVYFTEINITINLIIYVFLYIHIIILAFIYLKYREYIHFGFNSRIMFSYLVALFPLSLAPILHMIIFQSSIIILGCYYPPDVIAKYSIVLTIMMAIYYLPSLIANRYLLSYFISMNDDKRNYFKIMLPYSLIMLILIIILFFCSNFIFNNFLPANYNSSIYIFKILLFACFFRLLSIPIGTILNTEKTTPLKIKIMAIVALLNVISNATLIPIYGSDIIVTTTILTEILLFLSYSMIFKIK